MPKPPFFAQHFLSLLLHSVDHDSVLGDLEETYRYQEKRYGRAVATRWYWYQVIRSIFPLISRSIYWGFVMLQNYFKIALRNLRKQAGYAFINVFGLAIGLTCFILISLFVQFELSYDDFHANSDNIYRIAKENRENYEGTQQFAVTPLPLANALMEEFPEVEYATQVRKVDAILEHDNTRFDEAGIYTTSHFFDVFSFPLLQGDESVALGNPNAIILTERLARKYFGDSNPVGAFLSVTHTADAVPMEVVGVLEDIPFNSHMRFDFILPIQSSERYAKDGAAWDNNGYLTYAALRPDHSVAEFEAKLPALAEKHLSQQYYYQQNPGSISVYFPQALKEIHLRSNLRFEFGVNGDIKYIYLFSIVGLLILLLSVINYVNLATARSTTRVMEMGVRKIMGAHRKQLIGQFMAESVMPAVLALVIALACVLLFMPTFNHLMAREISLSLEANGGLLVVLIFIGLGAGVLSGSYPSFLLSSFHPVRMTKRMLGQKGGTSSVRNALLVVQFSITIGLIIGTLIIRQQLNYMQNETTGVDRERIVSVEVKDKKLHNQYNVIKQRLEGHPGVVSVTATHHDPTNIFSSESIKQWEGAPEDQNYVPIHYTPIQYNFAELLGIEVVEGRDFLEQMGADESGGLLVNETLVRELGWEQGVGKQIAFRGRVSRIIGVMKDFNFLSFHEKIAPLALFVDTEKFSRILIKVHPDNMQETIGFLGETMAEFSPAFPFEYHFLDDAYNNMYQTETRLGSLFSYFSMLALVIACLGLLGLAMFTTSQRTKELGVRKVLGASYTDILLLLTKDFTRLVVIAFVLAAPLAYFALDTWLLDFAYRISIGWTTFILAGAGVLLLTWLTISYQSIRATLADPVKSLRYE
ncbi:MAG: ABC transporter permease [Rhodothermales bacterium]